MFGLPFDVGELYGVIEVAYKVIDLGWNPANNARQQYVEFKHDVETLRDQLKTLQYNIEIGQIRTGAQLASSGQLKQIFDDFKETLEDCRRFLESRADYGNRNGPIPNIKWALVAKDEVNMHRDRIAVLNLKLSLALQSLEIESRDGQRILTLECTNLVIEKLEQINVRVSEALGVPVVIEPSPRLDIPQPLANLFESMAATRYENLTNIPMTEGLNEVIFYLDRATKWHTRRQQFTQPRHAFKMANVLRAYWLLQATRASEEYQAASNTITVAVFERQFPRLGMTARRFFDKLEERILEAHAQLVRSGEPQPSLHQLQEVVEKDGNAWQEHREWDPRREEEDTSKRGTKVATCHLQSTNPSAKRSVEIWDNEADQGYLTVITCDVGSADRFGHHADLKVVEILPVLEAASFSSGLYSISLSLITGRSETGRKLAFQGEEDLFVFQQWMTGYKVVDDIPGTLVTSQRANAGFGGERRSDTGRLQIWSSTRPSPGPQLPEELLDPEPPKKHRRATKLGIVSPYAPMLAPLAAFSRLSLSLEPTRSASTSNTLLEAQPAPQPHSVTPSLTRTSTTVSSASRSSSSLRGGLTRRPTNLVQVDNRGNVGCILDQPDPPRVVVLLPSSGGQRCSLLVIDINQYIRINPTLCDCQQDPNNDTAHNGSGITLDHNGILSLPSDMPARSPSPQQQQQKQQNQCRKVILQVVHAQGITARESDVASSSCNLASAGRYQDGEGLGRVKRLKKVVLGFGSVEERVRFVKYFTDLRELYLSHLHQVAG